MTSPFNAPRYFFLYTSIFGFLHLLIRIWPYLLIANELVSLFHPSLSVSRPRRRRVHHVKRQFTQWRDWWPTTSSFITRASAASTATPNSGLTLLTCTQTKKKAVICGCFKLTMSLMQCRFQHTHHDVLYKMFWPDGRTSSCLNAI